MVNLPQMLEDQPMVILLQMLELLSMAETLSTVETQSMVETLSMPITHTLVITNKKVTKYTDYVIYWKHQIPRQKSI